MMASFHDFDIFARVIATGSMTAAGRELGFSPALISKRMKRLEERLGVRLMQRTTRQIALTEVGQGFYERVLVILANVEEAENYVTRRTETVRGGLKVAAPTTFGRLHIAPYLNKLMEQNPDITITLDLSDDFVDLVADGIDVAIRIAELKDSSYVAKKLAPNTRVLCATPKYLELHGTPSSISDLGNHQCIAAASQEIWHLIGPDGHVNIKPDATIKTNSSEVVREAVIAGLGIAFRSTWDVGPELANGTLKVILPEYRGTPNVGVYAIYPSRQYLPTKVRVFLDFLNSLYGGSTPYWEAGLGDILMPKDSIS
ncbi:MAG: LysR family transcriptional regulator [Hyphomicrobiales bacterium]